MLLHYIILILFLFLLISHFSKFILPTYTIEGMTDSSVSGQPQYINPQLENDPIYLAKINAANITYLKSQIDVISTLKQQVTDISGVVHTNSENIKQFGKEMTSRMNSMNNQITDKSQPSTSSNK